MLLKVKGQHYNENIVTLRVFLICAYCLHIVRCVENVQIKENVFVKMKCEVSCLTSLGKAAAFGILDEKHAQIKLPSTQAQKIAYAYN